MPPGKPSAIDDVWCWIAGVRDVLTEADIGICGPPMRDLVLTGAPDVRDKVPVGRDSLRVRTKSAKKRVTGWGLRTGPAVKGKEGVYSNGGVNPVGHPTIRSGKRAGSETDETH